MVKVMSDIVITSIISGLCVAIPSITATITANKRNQELMSFQINAINKETIRTFNVRQSVKKLRNACPLK